MPTMEISIVSEECIKPSSPTLNHQKIHMLSFLDQVAQSAQAPVVLFYPVDGKTCRVTDDIVNERLKLLKHSLSKTLASFYPLAGRFKDQFSIDCNDEGVSYVEATVDSSLRDFLKQPPSWFINKLLPNGVHESLTGSSSMANVAMIKITRFACGGIAICASISHAIVDASSLCFFLKSWAAYAKNAVVCETAVPNFNGSIIFPQSHPCTDKVDYVLRPFLKRGRSAFKRFVFDARALVALKAKASSSSMQNPSRVECLTAFICKSIAAALKASSSTMRTLFTAHAVNLRSRALPSFPESFIGNYSCLATSTLAMEEDMELPNLVMKLREVLKNKYDSHFVNKMACEPSKYVEILKEIGQVASTGGKGEVEYIGFSSLCQIGFDEIDFGWGKPTWKAFPALTISSNVFLNGVLMMDTRCKNGIEAWIRLDERVMAMLQQNKEWIAFAAMDLSPLYPYNNDVVQPSIMAYL